MGAKELSNWVSRDGAGSSERRRRKGLMPPACRAFIMWHLAISGSVCCASRRGEMIDHGRPCKSVLDCGDGEGIGLHGAVPSGAMRQAATFARLLSFNMWCIQSVGSFTSHHLRLSISRPKWLLMDRKELNGHGCFQIGRADPQQAHFIAAESSRRHSMKLGNWVHGWLHQINENVWVAKVIYDWAVSAACAPTRWHIYVLNKLRIKKKKTSTTDFHLHSERQ